MKLSFTTLGCPDWSFDQILKEADRLHFDGVEIRGIDGIMRAEEIPLFFPENLENTRKYIEAHHVTWAGFGTSAGFHTEEKAKDGLEECRKAIDVCARANIPAIRVFGDQIPDQRCAQETIDRVGEHIAAVCRYAQDKNVQVLLEIHGDFNTIPAVSGVIAHCAAYPCFGILWDIEHSDRAYGDDWKPFYALIRPYLKHTHIKDHIRNEDGSFTLCLPGEGDIPIQSIVTTLEKDGYNGFYSLEWEKKWHPELPGPEVALPVYRDLIRSIEEQL